MMLTLHAALGPALALVAISSSVLAQLPPVPVPPENPITAEKAVLGKMLFWDEQLSSDNTMACGTCHLPANAGSDPRLGPHPGPDGIFGNGDDLLGSPGVARTDPSDDYQPDPAFGFGVQVTGRSAQSVIGSQWAPEAFWDGRAGGEFLDPADGLVSIPNGGALENQVLGPPVSDVEMAHEARSWDQITAKLERVDPLWLATNLPGDIVSALSGGATYPELFDDAFGTPEITAERIAFAIATYERTLVADETPWDLFMAGDMTALTADQQQGWNMLQNNTVCLNCHEPPLFTDNQFYNIGLRPADEDLGRFEVTGILDDRGRFKTPTLRNSGLRASFMHVGWITDMQDVIDYYNAPAWPEVDPVTGHTQYTADQSGIPTGGPFLADYNNIFMPRQTQGGVPFQARVIDFLTNGLTDPRVANEDFPFDRPTLHSEHASTNFDLLPGAVPGSGGIAPQMIALSPPNLGNHDFKVGVYAGLGGASAYLSYALTAPGGPFGGGPVAAVAAVPLFPPVVLTGSGPGAGHGTWHGRIPLDPSLAGLEVWLQWLVLDPSAPRGAARTDIAHLTIF